MKDRLYLALFLLVSNFATAQLDTDPFLASEIIDGPMINELELNSYNNNILPELDRINSYSAIEEDVKARCFCRVGDNRGARLKSYPNPIKDLGVLKSWGGPIGGTSKREDECGNLCSKKAYEWYNSKGKFDICNRIKSNKPIRITAYSKVGGRDWVTRGDYGTLRCCSSGGSLTCPDGWNSENNNFPGMCSKAICPPNVKGDRRLYNENGSPWGFIWKNMIYQLRQGKLSSVSWKPCN